jgi:hypothetical protein
MSRTVFKTTVRRKFRGRMRKVAALVVAATGVTFLLAGSALAGPAAFSTVGPGEDSHCQNGNPAVNCNIYDGKQYVWMNGGPSTADLGGDGIYFFAVVAPSGQKDPNDGSSTLLSSDARIQRTFSYDSSLTPNVTQLAGSPTHTQAGNLVNLLPYNDTPNPGGVYILAICRLGDLGTPVASLPATVTPSACKYDAFKVRPTNQPPPPPNQVNSCFSGTKYRDTATTNGQFDDATEVGLSGWTMNLDPGTPNNTSDDLTAVTDSSGNWSACEAAHDPGTAGSTHSYTVTETLQSGWKETGNTVDQSIVLGGATVTLNADFSYTVTVPDDVNASADGLNFGNIPQGKVWGAKYYDTNLNGQWDSGEVLISGWQLKQDTTVFLTVAAFTDGNGFAANFVRTLDPGTYSFSEVQASNWIQTGNTVDQLFTTGSPTASLNTTTKVYSVTIPNTQPSTVSKVYFGNVCLGAGGGLTLGFWSNKNGEAKMKDDGGVVLELALLSSLNLRNAAGGNFDPTTYAAFRTWILSATATNMAYMLSAQLAAMELNVEAGYVSGGSMVFAPDLGGFISISTLMSNANTELGLHAVTVSPSAFRSYQEKLKNALDAANNNLNFVQGSPTTCASPIFPTS